MDDLSSTFALIIELQLDDIDELHSRRSYENRDTALATCGENLRHACEQLEISLNGDDEDTQEILSPNIDTKSVDWQSSCDIPVYSESSSEPSSPTIPPPKTSTKNQRNVTFQGICDICREDRHSLEVLQTPCSHEWCGPCIMRHFEASLSNESSFPPRCCEEAIPVQPAMDFVRESYIRRFGAKNIELSTENRTYCARPGCSAFVPPACISVDIGTCQLCGHRTCTQCKGSSHGVEECPEDPNHQTLLTLISDNGWRRCYQCKMVIQRDAGCNHMTYVFLLFCFVV